MSRRAVALCGISVALLGACREPAAGREAPLRAALERARAGAEAPGAILGVQVGDDAPLVVAVGHLDLEGERDIGTAQPYFLGSISKVYTAATVLRLAEEGRLSLDDPLARWLPDFPRGDEIALRHLLAHTSGLVDFYSYLYFRPEREEMVRLVTKTWTEEELLALAGRFGHRFEPGADWAYSSTNYYLLGVVIERASGLALPRAYRRYLYAPLGLETTWLAWHEEAVGEPAVGFMGPVDGWEHSAMFGELGPTTALDRSPVEWGAGGLAAPADDALRFIAALMRGELLAASSLDAMTGFRPTPALGIAARDGGPDSETGYGLGLVQMVRRGFTLIGHGGLFTGHTAGSWYLPACDAAISLYFNRGFVGQRDLLDEVVALLADGTVGECRPRRP